MKENCSFFNESIYPTNELQSFIDLVEILFSALVDKVA